MKRWEARSERVGQVMAWADTDCDRARRTLARLAARADLSSLELLDVMECLGLAPWQLDVSADR